MFFNIPKCFLKCGQASGFDDLKKQMESLQKSYDCLHILHY